MVRLIHSLLPMRGDQRRHFETCVEGNVLHEADIVVVRNCLHDIGDLGRELLLQCSGGKV